MFGSVLLSPRMSSQVLSSLKLKDPQELVMVHIREHRGRSHATSALITWSVAFIPLNLILNNFDLKDASVSIVNKRQI